jgi:hypothetical protein
MDADMSAAVAHSYRIFSRYMFASGAAGDTVLADALGPLEARILRLTPVRELPADLLAAYADTLPHALAGVAAEDIRALLPRYFELTAAGAGCLDGRLTLVLHCLDRADFRETWKQEELAAIDRFLAALHEADPARGDGRPPGRRDAGPDVRQRLASNGST